MKYSRVAVLPISKTAKFSYKGSEFIGVYYFIQIAKSQKTGKDAIWVYDGDNYVIFNDWLKGQNPFRHTK